MGVARRGAGRGARTARARRADARGRPKRSPAVGLRAHARGSGRAGGDCYRGRTTMVRVFPRRAPSALAPRASPILRPTGKGVSRRCGGGDMAARGSPADWGPRCREVRRAPATVPSSVHAGGKADSCVSSLLAPAASPSSIVRCRRAVARCGGCGGVLRRCVCADEGIRCALARHR